MKRLWEITEQIIVLTGMGLVAIQITVFLELYILAFIIGSALVLAGGVLMLQFYTKKRR